MNWFLMELEKRKYCPYDKKVGSRLYAVQCDRERVKDEELSCSYF